MKTGRNMKALHALVVVLSLQLGRVSGQIAVYSQLEGEDVRVECSFSSPRGRMSFCRETCDTEANVVIGTSRRRAEKGRYSVKAERRQGRKFVSVTVAQLTKADSGLYQCSLQGSVRWIEIIVVDAMLKGSPGEERTLHGRAGGDVVVQCSFAPSESRKYFCRNPCEDNLAETDSEKVQKGRYSIEFIQGNSAAFLYVSISQLDTSDSGQYRCIVGTPPTYVYIEFELVVRGVTSATPTTTTRNLSSDANQSTETPPTTGVWPYVGGTLAALVLLLTLALLCYCRNMSSQAKEASVNAELTSVSRANPASEAIMEDRRSRALPGQIYTGARNAKAAGRRPSPMTAASSQKGAEDKANKLTYSELKFSGRTVGSSSGSSSGAVRGRGETVVYSCLRTPEEPPVYSWVT